MADKIKMAIKSGELTPDKLKIMNSADRRDYFTQLLGSEGDAQQLNLTFEQKLLLKNQERAMYDWAKTVTGLNKEQRQATIEKIRAAYADKNRRLYNPDENEQFLDEVVADVYTRKYKTSVSLKEAETITKMTQELKQAKDKMNKDFTWDSKEDGLRYGAAQQTINRYMGDLRTKADERPWINILQQQGIWDKISAIGANTAKTVDLIASNARALKATFDNSFFGRQGIKVLYTHPTIWAKAFAKSWSDIGKTILYGNKAGDAVIDAVKADIYSRQNYLNGRYDVKGERKLDVGVGEEEFPTSLPSKIPVLGRFFKAAEVAYEAGAMRMRADLADKFYKMAESQGRDMDDKFEIGSINEMVNSLTGRGRFGKADMGRKTQSAANKAFFSIKFFKSNYDTLTLHAGSKMSSFARNEAAKNLLKIVSGIAVTLGIAGALGWEVEKDPASSDFGTIKIGNTRFDVTGGMKPLVALAYRIATQSSKSSTTGLTTKFGEGYGAMTGMDAIWSFTENKFSPLFTVIKEWVKQETFEGDKPTAISTIRGLTVPIIFENIQELNKTPGAANMLLSIIAEGLGFSTNTYRYEAKWDQSDSEEMKEFKAKVGEEAFKAANDQYNNKINDYINKLKTDKEYQSFNDEEQADFLSKIKDDFKDEIIDKDKFYRNMSWSVLGDPTPDQANIDYSLKYLKEAGLTEQDMIDYLYKYEDWQVASGNLKSKTNKNHLNTMQEKLGRIKKIYEEAKNNAKTLNTSNDLKSIEKFYEDSMWEWQDSDKVKWMEYLKSTGDTIEEPDSKFTQAVNKIVGNVKKFLSKLYPEVDSPEETALMKEMYDIYPFTQEFKDTVQNEPFIAGGDAWEISRGERTAGTMYNYRQLPIVKDIIKVIEKIGVNLPGSSRTWVRYDDEPTVAAHEFLHSYLEKKTSGELNTVKAMFNSNIEVDKATNFYWTFLDIKDKYPQLQSIFEHYQKYYGEPSLNYSTIHEMWAYVGEELGYGGLKSLPKELQPFYSDVFEEKKQIKLYSSANPTASRPWANPAVERYGMPK